MTMQFSTMMRDAISNVLETMFFLVPAFEEGVLEESCREMPFEFASSITITGEKQRLMLLFRATRVFASILTSNFLGVGKEEVSLDEMEDTLKELANMVGGDCLARLPADNWSLGIPQLEPLLAAPGDHPPSYQYSLLLSLDEERMALIQVDVEP